MAMTNNTLYVDRIEASKLLKVSTRTVDRYMRKYRLKTRRDGRRILLKKTDLETIIKEHIGRLADISTDNLEALLATDPSAKTESPSALTVSDIKVKKISNERLAVEQEIYKELYQEVKKELRERQDRLEAATYRVGQLEAQAKNMVPMLDYNKKDRALQDAYTAMHQRTRQAEDTIQAVENKLRNERVAKWVYLSLIGLLLVAEPILFLMWAFN